jgi:hypothetical protein|tara:strand:- start:1799 stop:2818 length:1020 start_codon:yes stop_codon:yes gene_type:complete
MEKMKVVNLCGSKYLECGGDWGQMYFHVMHAFHALGYKVRVSPFLKFYDELPSFVEIGIQDNPNDVYVYNHMYIEEVVANQGHLGSKTLFLKPTGPEPECFTIDPQGFAGASSIAYNRPAFSSIRVGDFFNITAKKIIDSKLHKWTNRSDITVDAKLEQKLPKDYTLVLGQMPGDSTVLDVSFGDHWAKLKLATLKLLAWSTYPVVLKLHPCLMEESGEEELDRYLKDIALFEEQGAIVLKEALNIHDVLPGARVVVLENSTAGVDALLHEKPVISFGYPEYHWVTKDLRHLYQLPGFVDNLDWYKKDEADKWVCWYYNNYLCKTEKETYHSIKSYIEP